MSVSHKYPTPLNGPLSTQKAPGAASRFAKIAFRERCGVSVVVRSLLVTSLASVSFACSEPSRADSKQTPATTRPTSAADKEAGVDVYAHQVKDIDGNPVSLQRYAGKVTLIVNTASECGYTPQYGDLEELYRSYRGRAFEILAFPSNDFGGQEPNDEAFIKSFTADNFGISFPLFSKVQTRGRGKSPLYETLTEKGPAEFRGEVGWNFTKFVVGPEGQILARFSSGTSPTSAEIRSVIDAALAQIPGATRSTATTQTTLESQRAKGE